MKQNQLLSQTITKLIDVKLRDEKNESRNLERLLKIAFDERKRS